MYMMYHYYAGVEVQYALPTKRGEVPVSDLYSTVSKPKVHCPIDLYGTCGEFTDFNYVATRCLS